MEVDAEQYARLLRENARLTQALNQATGRLEELENTVGAIREGLIDAVVVYQEPTPQVWCLESSDRLRLRLVLQAARAGTWEWDIERGVVTWSNSLAAIFGLDETAVNPRNSATSGIHADDRERVLAHLQRASAGGDSFYDEFRIIGEDGKQRWLAAWGQLVPSANEQPTRMVGIHLDITERCKVEEELRQQERNKNNFLATLAHELRNPFAAIANAVQISRVEELDSQRRRWTEEVIDRQMQQVGRLMEDLLDLSRIAQGKVELRAETVALSDVIDNAVKSVRSLYEQGDYTLTVTVAPGPLWVLGDAGRLEQVFSNLLTNAARYNRPCGSVAVSAAVEAQQAVITIRDSGVGIAPEMLPNVFNLFVQANAPSHGETGLGIGLSLVRSIVEMHGGSVEARSAGLGLGSEFIVRLPIASAPMRAAKLRNENAPDKTPLRILIVDDNEDAAQTLSFLLAHAGHRTAYATDVERAIEMARQLRPHVALLDIGLCGADGRQLGGELRRTDPSLSLIAISGYGGEEARSVSLEHGFHEHLVKPVTAEDVLKTIDEACRHRTLSE